MVLHCPGHNRRRVTLQEWYAALFLCSTYSLSRFLIQTSDLSTVLHTILVIPLVYTLHIQKYWNKYFNSKCWFPSQLLHTCLRTAVLTVKDLQHAGCILQPCQSPALTENDSGLLPALQPIAPLFSNTVFVTDNMWQAQKSNNKTVVRFRLRGQFLPTMVVVVVKTTKVDLRLVSGRALVTKVQGKYNPEGVLVMGVILI